MRTGVVLFSICVVSSGVAVLDGICKCYCSCRYSLYLVLIFFCLALMGLALMGCVGCGLDLTLVWLTPSRHVRTAGKHVLSRRNESMTLRVFMSIVCLLQVFCRCSLLYT